MSSLSRGWIAIGALLGAVGVGLGAFAAHGLEEVLRNSGFVGHELVRRSENFETAVHYQMLHAIALVITGILIGQRPSAFWRFAAWAFLLGIVLFCGLLKILTFADAEWNWLGAVVPIGGVSLIVGWVALAAGALVKGPTKQRSDDKPY